MPEFSIIVPVYNVEPYLRQCVDSILAQTFADFELFLVDDGSPDGCPAICDEYAARDSRISVIHQPNQGVVTARKAALDRTAGDYVCFVDGDDWVREDWLQTAHRYLAENDWPDMFIFSMAWEGREGKPPVCAPPGYYDKARLEAEIYPYMLWDRRRPFLFQGVPGYQWITIIRRPLLREHYIQDSSIAVLEDTTMIYECLYNARSLYITSEALYIYRYRTGSASHLSRPDMIFRLKRCRDYMLAHLGQQAPEMRVQIDAYFAHKIRMILQHGSDLSIRALAGQLADGLRKTGMAGELTTGELPFYMRALFFLLRHRLYYTATTLYRLYYLSAGKLWRFWVRGK